MGSFFRQGSQCRAVNFAVFIQRHLVQLHSSIRLHKRRQTFFQRSQQGGRRLFWERLDYQVGEAGPGKARIVVELYTLSREAGWVGV